MNEPELVVGLNRDLAQELGAICRGIQQAALARGTTSQDLRVLLKTEIIDNIFHALYLADKIAALGGMPTAIPEPFLSLSDPAAMVEYDLKEEHRVIKQYTERLQQATGTWALGLQARLEKILADEAEHEQGLRKLLDKGGARSRGGHNGETPVAREAQG